MNNQKQQNSVSFGGQQRPAGVPQNSYVKTVLVGFLRFTVMMANPGNYIGPEFELDCVNDLITVSFLLIEPEYTMIIMFID
jgi:hypothetical protein